MLQLVQVLALLQAVRFLMVLPLARSVAQLSVVLLVTKFINPIIY
jgi:hypothetical protein